MAADGQVSLFGDGQDEVGKGRYRQFRIRSDKDMIRFLRQFIAVEESPITKYRHKDAYYRKKGHYINGKKVNRQVYKYVKAWLESGI